MLITAKELFRYDPVPRKYLRALFLPDTRLVLPGSRPRLDAATVRAQYPEGVSLGIWHDAVKKAEMYTFSGCAVKWSATWSGLGPQLAAGKTWRDGTPLADAVLDLHAAVRQITQDDGPWTKIRDLAIFTHGQTTAILYGKSHIQIGHLDALVGKIAAALSPSVRVILYACNTGRAPALKPEEWLRDTLEDGGATSFAAALRDRLVAAGKSGCEVWSHTTKGHTAYNSALRVFRGSDGAGSDGVSFAREWGHDWSAEYEPRARAAVAAAGFKVGAADEARFLAAAATVYRKKFYAVYGATMRNKERLVDGRRLAMAAPMDPDAVGAIVRSAWNDRWQANRVAWGKLIAKQARLHA